MSGMTTVNMRSAKAQLSKLVKTVESGAESEIIITRNGRPVARLVLMGSSAPKRIGVAKGKFVAPDPDEDEDALVAALLRGGK